MAQNYIQDGRYGLEIPIGAAVVSGTPVLYGTKLGIPLRSETDTTQKVAHAFAGVWGIDKTTTEAWTVGAALYWNNTTKKLTTTSSGNTLVAWAADAADAAATTGVAKLIE
jgi:predicted RecA/RadA family phage recombinase